MRRVSWLIFGLASAVSAGPIALQPACVAGTLASYIALPGTGCSQASATPQTFFGFGFLSTGGGPLTAADISVQPVVGSKSGGFSISAPFHAGPSDNFTYLIYYTIDPPPVIHGFDMDMLTETPKNGAKATIITELCRGGIFTSPWVNNNCLTGQVSTLTTFYDSSTPAPTFDLSDSASFQPVAFLGVRMRIILKGNGGDSSITGAKGSSAVLPPVPEPATVGMMAAGLALLAFRSRKR